MLVTFLAVQALAAAAASPVLAGTPALSGPPAATATVGQTADRSRLAACIDDVDRDADAAYETARQWIAEAHVREAYVCAAIADAGRNKPDQAARQFESLSIDAPDNADRAAMLSRAGNAWLLARDAGRAKAAFDRAIAASAKDPDLFVDRARAHAMAGSWRAAEEDLSSALDLRPKDPLTLRLRAEARLRQSVFELAEKDAADAVALDPKNVDGLLMLGRAREARRTGRAPE